MNKELRKKYFCTVPFNYTEISDNSQWLCCPTWMPTNIKESNDYKKNWYSETSNKLRASVMDGSYKYCDSIQCPHLSNLDSGKVSKPFSPIEDSEKLNIVTNPKPMIVTFGWDPSCNLQCPSCRLEFVNLKGKLRDKVNTTIDNITETIGKDIRSITLCGAGDPFFSKSYVMFMKTFDKRKFPNLKNIHLHTNAVLWTRKLWETMTDIHPYVKSCEISIDAATKDTYENKVRIRGDWDKLMDNINFIKTIPTLKTIRFSFVTQRSNYKEMKLFFDIISDIMKDSGKKYEILFNAITDWGAYPTKEDFLKEEVHKPHHTEYTEFVKELEKVINLPIVHNFHHIMTKKRSLL